MAFSREELRKILGEAHTDEIATQLITLHRTVVDPLKDDLDSAKREATKYRTEAEKLPELRKQLEEYKNGEDWKAKYEKEKADHDAYRDKVAQDAEVAKKKAAYRKLLTEEKISEKTLDAVMNATDYTKMKLKEDGTLDGVEDLKKDIETKWGGFRVQQRKRGESVETPPAGAPGGEDTGIRSMTARWHAQRFGTAQNPSQNQ